MSHEISQVVDTVTGEKVAEAMYAGTPAWHGLGTVVKDAPNSAEAMKLAHLDWTVKLTQAGYVAQKINDDGSVVNHFIPSSYFASVRGDTGDVLGMVTEKYGVVQNHEGFAFLDALLDAGELKFESAMALKGGRVVALLARLPQPSEIAEGDTVHPFLLFSNAHDGTAALKVLPTQVRVVCNNTLTLALRQSESQGISIKHIGNITDKLAAARDILKMTGQIFALNVDASRKLAARPLADSDFIAYLDKLFPIPSSDASKTKTTMVRNLRSTVTNNYLMDVRQNLPSIKRTAWAAYNAVTQMVDHGTDGSGGRTRQVGDTTPAEARFVNSIFGTGAKRKDEAFKLAVEMFATA